jgi:predicted DNA-binding transcriptional regulator AlpA
MTEPIRDRRIIIDRRRRGRGSAPEPVQRRESSAEMWTAEDVAAHLKVSVSWVRHRVAANKLPRHRIGGWIVRFDPAEIRVWATSRGKR